MLDAGVLRFHSQTLKSSSLWPLIAALTLLLFAGCTIPDQPVTSHGGPVRDHVSLVDNLRAAGFRVDPVGPVSQPFLTASGERLQVEGEMVQVFEYPDEGSAANAAGQVSADGSQVGNTSIDWVAPPHFYRKGKVLVIYLGDKADVLQALEGALGRQFAGR